jgi:peptidoglycan/xylan/chitin deacetylase (PgdA/CDA1 family)
VSAQTVGGDIRQATAEVPVLMYHSIGSTGYRRFRRFAVDPAEFAAQMDYLHAQGYRLVTAAELAAREASGDDLPPRLVVLTFDDAYEDFYTAALPVLRRHGFPATLYVPTAYVGLTSQFNASTGEGDRRIMSWPALRDVVTEGVEVGSHSHTHPQLDLVPQSAVDDEVSRSQRILEDELGVSVEGFSYPFGYWNKAARAAVSAAGFRYAVAVADLKAAPGDDMLTLPRLSVRAGIGVTGLARLLDAEPTLLRRAASQARKTGSRAVRQLMPGVLEGAETRQGSPAG